MTDAGPVWNVRQFDNGVFVMRELNVVEMQQVSGGCNFFDTIGAMISGAFYGLGSGAAKGAASAGGGGGFLGFGLIGQLVGGVFGGIWGALSGAWYGATNGSAQTNQVVSHNLELWADPTSSYPKV
jgi:hypothetical protein